MTRSQISILVVDDDLDGAESMRVLLAMRGYAVEAITDSTQCLTHLAAQNPDIVMLDIGMPKLCGYDVAKQIRAQPEFATVPIIAISGFADGQHQARSVESGIDQYLVKPVKLADLEHAIIQEVEKRLQQFGVI